MVQEGFQEIALQRGESLFEPAIWDCICFGVYDFYSFDFTAFESATFELGTFESDSSSYDDDFLFEAHLVIDCCDYGFDLRLGRPVVLFGGQACPDAEPTANGGNGCFECDRHGLSGNRNKSVCAFFYE